MATFYGMIQGNRGVATRGGSFASGYKATAQSYDGSIIVYLDYNQEKELTVRLCTSDKSSTFSDSNSKDFNGTFKELKQLLALNDDIKNNRVKIIRHRTPKEAK